MSRRRGFTLIELLVVIAIIVVLLVLLIEGNPVLDGTIVVLFGWIKFLWRVVPQARPSPSAVVSGALCLFLLLGGLHLFLRWFARQMRPPEGAPPRFWRLRWTLALVVLVLLAFTAGIGAVGVTHQTVWLVRSPEPLTERYRWSSRAVAANNLKQIGVALHTFHDHNKRGKFPAGASFDAHGRPLHSWQTTLLPYIEQEQLYKRIKHALPWDHPANAEAFATVIPTYQYPQARQTDEAGLALSHFAGNAHVLGGDMPLSLKQIQSASGTSQTILAGEAAGNFRPWGHPLNWRDPARGLNRRPDGFGNPIRSRGPTQFVFADGSVRTFNNDNDPDFLELLARPGPRK